MHDFLFLYQTFCSVNAYLQASYFLALYVYPRDWLGSLWFIAGVLIFALGFISNIQADSILRNLRKPGETGYKVPYGGLFDYVSAANYGAELIEW